MGNTLNRDIPKIKNLDDYVIRIEVMDKVNVENLKKEIIKLGGIYTGSIGPMFGRNTMLYFEYSEKLYDKLQKLEIKEIKAMTKSPCGSPA